MAATSIEEPIAKSKSFCVMLNKYILVCTSPPLAAAELLFIIFLPPAPHIFRLKLELPFPFGLKKLEGERKQNAARNIGPKEPFLPCLRGFFYDFDSLLCLLALLPQIAVISTSYTTRLARLSLPEQNIRQLRSSRKSKLVSTFG